MGLSLFQTGHVATCPALQKEGTCECESTLYAATGLLALLAGIIQWWVGYYASMTLASDALHALADAGADFLGMWIAIIVIRRPVRGAQLRDLGNKIIAATLAIGAAWIIHEAWGRWTVGAYKVYLPAVVVVGLMGLVVDLLRFSMLAKAHAITKRSTTAGLVEHARSDAVHSAIVAFVGAAALTGTLVGENAAYAYAIRLGDFLCSVVLAGYMVAVLTPRIWHGETHNHDHDERDESHHHEHCRHHDHDHRH